MSSTSCFKHAALAAALLVGASACSPADNFPALEVGVTAPAFAATTLNGEKRSMGDYRGSGLVMVFMSSWCPCSNESIPIVKQAYRMHHEADGVEFLLIGIQEARSKFERFVDKRGIPFPAAYDTDKKISRAYGVNAPPTMVFIDKDGKVKRVFYGNIKDKKQELAEWIEEIT